MDEAEKISSALIARGHGSGGTNFHYLKSVR